MKIALVGGTHGNEPVGIEVMKFFRDQPFDSLNSYQCFWGNPKAYQLKKRYVDFDLNRSFGKKTRTQGYEAQRAKELTAEIHGQFDFCIDLHTTTSNMGLTAILNNTHWSSRQAAALLADKISKLKLIEEMDLDDECTHLNRLCPGGLTIEVGPVANNVVSAKLVFDTIEIVKNILNFNFEERFELANIPYYKMLEQINYPDQDGWLIHPDLEENDFVNLSYGTNVFINKEGQVKQWKLESTVYPFFINEAAYLEHRSAFLIASFEKGWS